MKLKKWLLRISKVTAWFIFSLILFLILVILIIRIPAVQRRLVQGAVQFIENKIGTPVTLRRIELSFPKKVVLKDLYLQDKSRDTLLYAAEIAVDTDLWGLLQHRVQLNDVELTHITSTVYRLDHDSAFNFTYIVRAFADNEKNTVDTLPGTPWTFSIHDVNIESLRFHYRDDLEGNDVALNLGKLAIGVEKFDPAISVFHINNIMLQNADARVIQSKISQDQDTTSVTALPDVVFHKIELSNVKVHYEQRAKGQLGYVAFGNCIVQSKDINVKTHTIELKEILLTNTFASYQQMQSNKKDLFKTNAIARDTGDVQLALFPWNIAIGKMAFQNNSIQYDDFNQLLKRKGLDLDHFWVSNFSTEIEDVTLNGKMAGANVKHFSLREKNGFTLRTLAVDFKLTDHTLDLHNFIFDSGRSNIRIEGDATFGSWSDIVKTYPHAKISMAVNHSHIDVADLLYFKPNLLDSLPVRYMKSLKVNVDLSMNGTVDNLNIRHLEIETLGKTTLRAHGIVQGLPDLDHADMNIDLDKFYTTSQDARSIFDSLSFESFALPEWVNIEGKFEGTIQRPVIHSALTSDIGAIDIDAEVDLDSTFNGQHYHGNFVVSDFELGKLLRKEQTIGKVNMKASINGSGLSMQALDANVNLDVASFRFHDYDYTNFKLSGTQKKYLFSGKAFLHDQNLDFDIAADINYNEKVPVYKLTCDLKNADFKALHLSDRPLRTRGILDVDLATADMKVINGSIALRRVAIFNGQALYKVDSLLFASIDQDGQTEVKITSDILNGSFTGTLNLFGLPDALERYFNNYFALKNGIVDQATKPENFKFNLLLKKTELLTDIIFPELTSFEPGPITGEFNNLEHKLNMHIALGKIHYADYVLDSFLLDVNSTKRAITCKLQADNFMYDSIHIYTLRLDGRVSNDSLRTSFVILDSLNKEKYKLGGLFRSLENVFQFHFLKDEVIMNYEEWETPSDNYFRFGRGGITTNNMSISNKEQRIVVERSTDSTATLRVGFRTLELETLSGIISGKKAIVAGKLNGDLNIPITPKSLFHAGVKISDLVILKQSWGDVDFSVHAIMADKLKLSLSIAGENTDVKAEGTYSSVSSDIRATIAKMNLKIIEPIIAKNIRDMSGMMTAKMTIHGDLKKPVIQGEVSFKDARFLSIYVNSAFRLKNETFEFNENGILFKNFKIQDDNNNIASLQGSIKTPNFTNIELDLIVSAKDFQVLNTGPKDNKLYYGKVKVNSRAVISGTAAQPIVEMNVAFSDDTQLTYVIPQSEKGVLEQKGIVVFIDKDEKRDPFIASIHLADTVQSVVKGVSLTANIELSNKEIFNIIIDPITGDKLSVQGTSSLTFEMNPNGNMNLSGRYEISKGSYSLSFYKLVKRTFSIERGGTIIWYGDPLNAILDIRAIYKVETSPMELLVTQVQVAPEQFKQRVPFYVYLNIKGELLTPNISFLLDMPQDKRNILGGAAYAKIQDINTRDSDLNKQVFALLVLQRFMADNPFENQAAGDLATSARTSVSKILSDQLNRLSQNVKGVQLNFDVKSYEDYTTGQAAGQTQLQLGVSKNLLNDRLVVKLSGNVDVEGENNAQSSFTDYIGDLALEYKLTTDGRLRVTGFRNSDYDMIDGELTKTGAGLIYIKDYNAFKELFKANEEQK